MPDTANYVKDLDETYPLASHSIGDGDNEIRTVKRAVKQSFAGDPAGTYNNGVPDQFDAGDGVLNVGPRFLNALPAALAAGTVDLAVHEARLDAAELALIPVGLISLWIGQIVDIPPRWILCDGTNGTPDLRDRFIIGAGNSYAVGAAGGAGSVTSGSSGAHTHSVTVDDHTLTVAEMPLHGHPWYHATGVQNSTESGAAGGLVTSTVGGTFAVEPAFTGTAGSVSGEQIGGTGGGAAHNHTGSTASDGAHTHSVTTLPPYFALCYIMFTG